VGDLTTSSQRSMTLGKTPIPLEVSGGPLVAHWNGQVATPHEGG
jgi:hypothetical protein